MAKWQCEACEYIYDEKIGDPAMEITPTDGMIVQVGKRKFAKLIIK